MSNFREKTVGWDWLTILIVALLVLMGIVNIYSAAFNPDRPFLFDLKTMYGKQIMWIGIGLFLGIVISLIDAEYIRKLTPAAFVTVVILLIVVLFTEPINGARSWLGIGPFGVQPSEFSKLTTALMLAYVISDNRGKLISKKSLTLALALVIGTMLLILIQNDTGTFLVFTAFFFVMYREGITFDPIILFFSNRVLGLRFKHTLVGIHFIPVLFVVIFLSIITLYFTESRHTFSFLPGYDAPGWMLLLIIITVLFSVSFFINQSFAAQRSKKKMRSAILIVYIVTVGLVGLISYTYLNVLQSHQKDRIDLWLGKIQDQDGKDYNRNRALAAVGSGGFSGVGYKEAILSSPRSQHVPESETDFIFSVYSEEWGFLGSASLVVLFTILLIRIIVIAERQKSRFARVYANSVAMIIFYHFGINVGMNIGIIPVIGIPLPFFSYGGSSMMSFLIMILILLKLDSQRKEVLA
ncbi:rod shape-determining protein RodA [Brumimicrobium mesophilum]|uniref:rod shape-determining protein RodA n=1 Tax=Brumimicrobium mesophilum TaxID=392717 RepID=UPI000D140AFA|nr:rod shape-determining protein RodA [Brumimicrobium mesophilum]